MQAENTVQAYYDHYPDLFQTRAEVFDHLFCVIGNGFKWQNGELVPTVKNDMKPPLHRLTYGKAVQHRKSDRYDRIMRRHELTRAQRWYGIDNQYSALMTRPDDIKPDWLELSEECLAMLVEDGLARIEDGKIIPLEGGIMYVQNKAQEVPLPATDT
jgi:hypothetical protein